MSDEELKDAFRALRETDAARAPRFDARRRQRGVHAALIVVPSFAVLASAAAVILFIGQANKPAASPAPVAAAVSAAPTVFDPEPLGFLLETPALGTPDFDSDPTGKQP